MLHGLNGDDAEVFVLGGVDEEFCVTEESFFEGIWHGEKEENFDVIGNGEGCGNGSCGCIGKVFGIGEGD